METALGIRRIVAGEGVGVLLQQLDTETVPCCRHNFSAFLRMMDEMMMRLDKL